MGAGFAKRMALPAVLGVVGAVLVFVGVPTRAAVAPLQRPYLALGDSITFGYVSHPAPSDGTNPFADPDNFTGYPTFVGAARGLHPVNAACPGETSSSMITIGLPDAGCAGYRSSYPLHVAEAGITQLPFAEAFLRGNPDTRLVTIAIGLNDVGLAAGRCGGPESAQCVERTLPPVLTTLRSNLTAIVRALRATGTHATIVLVNYYALEYANPETVAIVRALDSTIARAAAAEHLRVADTYDAFKRAADGTNGDACAAGLFGPGRSTLGPCDIHPDAAGQQVLAATVESALHT